MSVSISGDGALTGIDQGLNVVGVLTASGGFSGNLTGTASTATAAATAYGISGSPTLSGITSISTSNLTVNGNAYPATGPLSNRNLIINGAMNVAQRGTSFTAPTDNYTLDRWRFADTTSAVFDVTQSSTAPAGFSNSLKVDCTTSGTPTTNQESYLNIPIEAQDLQHLKYGTAEAQSLTLSFYVRSNKTGSYGLWIYQDDASSSYSTTYTISSANTWEYKTIIIPGNTASSINNDNGMGLLVRFYLQAGPTFSGTPTETWTTSLNSNRTTDLNLGDSTSNEWYLSGVQLEVGSVATPFEHRTYGDELARCQRYYEKSFAPNVAPANGPNATSYYTDNGIMTGLATNKNGMGTFISFAVKKRTTPDITQYGNSSGQWSYQQINSTTTTFSANLSAARIGTGGFSLNQQTVDSALVFVIGHWSATAEL